MIQILIYTFLGFVVGFGIAWLIRTNSLAKLKKKHQEKDGYLEREKLGKERLQRETELLYQREVELAKKLKNVELLTLQMDSDILLLQKSNEETEALLNVTEPEVYALKLKLIEANNTIARMKSKV